MDKIEFLAEARLGGWKKLICGDIEYKVTFNTDDKTILDIGKLSPETVFKVSLEVNDD